MSWANKAFRSVLTHKSSRPVWIAAFDNIPEGLRPPPCPQDLTEIAYANLLYNSLCMVCVRYFVLRLASLIHERRVVACRVAQRIGMSE